MKASWIKGFGPFYPSCCNLGCLGTLLFELSSTCSTMLLESCYRLIAKVVQNFTTTVLAKT
jgi:hypothetical protein